MKSTKNKIEIMTAALEGKPIEVFMQNAWKDLLATKDNVDNIEWKWGTYDYRIKIAEKLPAKSKTVLTIEELRNQGFTVKINHYRPFIIKTKSRCPQEVGSDLGESRIIHLPRHFKSNKSLQLLTKGGYATVQILNQNKVIVTEAISLCSEHDVYCYATGRKNCLEKIDKSGALLF